MPSLRGRPRACHDRNTRFESGRTRGRKSIAEFRWQWGERRRWGAGYHGGRAYRQNRQHYSASDHGNERDDGQGHRGSRTSHGGHRGRYHGRGSAARNGAKSERKEDERAPEGVRRTRKQGEYRNAQHARRGAEPFRDTFKRRWV